MREKKTVCTCERSWDFSRARLLVANERRLFLKIITSAVVDVIMGFAVPRVKYCYKAHPSKNANWRLIRRREKERLVLFKNVMERSQINQQNSGFFLND